MPVISLVAVAAALIVILPMLSEDPGDRALARATDLRRANELQAAVDALRTIPAEHRAYAIAQEQIVELEEQIEADRTRRDSRRAADDFARLERIRTDYVDRARDENPDSYRGYARYLVKRTREFIEDFPDHPNAIEARGYLSVYEPIARMDEPPTEDDVRAELAMRLGALDYAAAMDAVDEYAAASSADPQAVTALRRDVEQAAAGYWADFRARMERDGLLAPGEERWQNVADRIVSQFLPRVEGVEGVDAEARALLERAERGG